MSLLAPEWMSYRHVPNASRAVFTHDNTTPFTVIPIEGRLNDAIIRVYALAITARGGVEFRFESEPTPPLTGAPVIVSPNWEIDEPQPLVLPWAENGWMDTRIGHRLNIVLGANEQVDCLLQYQILDVTGDVRGMPPPVRVLNGVVQTP